MKIPTALPDQTPQFTHINTPNKFRFPNFGFVTISKFSSQPRRFAI
jgi:hypothetical protein